MWLEARSFFEKKKQKTFLGAGFSKGGAEPVDKSFLVLFFKKGLLAFPSYPISGLDD
jgi:hypothetical protein